MTNELNVYIGNVANPAVGMWFNLLEAHERECALNVAEGMDGYIIADYEADFNIDENDSIDYLTKIGELASELDEAERAVFFAELDAADDYDDLVNEINWNYTIIHITGDDYVYSSNSHEALGYFEADCLELNEVAERYFDYEKFGRDCAYDYTELEIDDGYLFYRAY